MRRHILGWACVLAAALLVLVWRQTQGASWERRLRERELERAQLEGERLQWIRRIEELQSRARILPLAQRMGLTLPPDSAVVLLQPPRDSLEP